MAPDPALNNDPMDNEYNDYAKESLQSNCLLDESSVFDLEPNGKISTSGNKGRAMKPLQAQIRTVAPADKALHDGEIRIELDRGKAAAKPGRFIDERKRNPAFLFEI